MVELLSLSRKERISKMCTRLAVSGVQLPNIRKQSGELEQCKVSETEDSNILVEYFIKSPLMFLQKYKMHLLVEDIDCFSMDEQNETTMSYHLNDIRNNASTKASSKKSIKNRRYNAMQKLIKEEDYFTLASIKKRYPKLFDQYIGRYMTATEREDFLKEEMREEKQAPTLSSWLLQILEKDKNRAAEADNVEEFDSDSSEEEEEVDDEEVSTEEKETMKEEFLSKVYNLFVSGKDPVFDYSKVDNNAMYDDLVQQDQDTQDNYFDEEEATVIETCNNKSDSEDELDCYMREINSEISCHHKIMVT